MQIIIFGAAGAVGSRIAAEALARGHDVIAVVRNAQRSAGLPAGVTAVIADAANPDDVAQVTAGQDLIISALRPPDGQEATLVTLTRAVLDGAARSGARILVVGGAASLKMPDASGATVLSTPGFLPESVLPIARACAAQYAMIRAEEHARWAYLCPPAMLTPGARTGHYRAGSDTLLLDTAGRSAISMEDFAVALLDEAEQPKHVRQRFTVAY